MNKYPTCVQGRIIFPDGNLPLAARLAAGPSQLAQELDPFVPRLVALATAAPIVNASPSGIPISLKSV